MRRSLVVLVTALALVLGFATLADAAGAKKSFKVSLKSNVATSKAGKFITLSGKVSGPNAGGKKVKIQRQFVGGAWTTVATVVTKGSGKYKAVVETPLGGTTSFRAIKAKSSARKTGISPTKALPVFKWIYLSNEPGITPFNSFTPGISQNIDGVTYQHSFLINQGPVLIRYKAAGLCTAFTTRADYQVTNGPQPFDDYGLTLITQKALGGTTEQTEYDVKLQTPRTVTSVIPAATRYFTVDVESIDPDPYYAVLGDPQVYCNADHLPGWTSLDFL